MLRPRCTSTDYIIPTNKTTNTFQELRWCEKATECERGEGLGASNRASSLTLLSQSMPPARGTGVDAPAFVVN